MRDEMEKFERAGVQPFGVNPAGIESHEKYVRKFGFPFVLLSDPTRSITRGYHALKDDDHGVQRTVYVVTRDGRIAFARRGAPSVNDIVAAVDVRD